MECISLIVSQIIVLTNLIQSSGFQNDKEQHLQQFLLTYFTGTVTLYSVSFP